MEKTMKKTVWKNIFRLILPYRKKFLWVVTLGLLSTGASLVEPLIYREAINDVAGLFVRQARENAQKDLGLDPGETDSIQAMIRNEVPDSSASKPDSIVSKADSSSLKPAPLLPAANSAASKRAPAVKVPEPHPPGHVAARSPRQALDTLLWAV